MSVNRKWHIIGRVNTACVHVVHCCSRAGEMTKNKCVCWAAEQCRTGISSRKHFFAVHTHTVRVELWRTRIMMICVLWAITVASSPAFLETIRTISIAPSRSSLIIIYEIEWLNRQSRHNNHGRGGMVQAALNIFWFEKPICFSLLFIYKSLAHGSC